MFIIVLFIIANNRKPSNCPSVGNYWLMKEEMVTEIQSFGDLYLWAWKDTFDILCNFFKGVRKVWKVCCNCNKVYSSVSRKV